MFGDTEVILDDVMRGLATQHDGKFQTCITSVPYWGQRDYGFEGQIGLEPTIGEHIQSLVEVFREVRRTLRHDGTLWLNYGDSFAGAVNGRSAVDTKAAGNDDRKHVDKPTTGVGPVFVPRIDRNRRGSNSKDTEASDHGGRIIAGGEIKERDLIGAPWSLALALRADGWYLRQCVIWSKPNPKPESTKTRPATSHEYVFLFSKSPDYFFDMEAVKEPAAPARKDTKSRVRKPSNAPGHAPEGIPFFLSPTRNLRSVWTINVQPFKGAHFATFPEELVRICVEATTPAGGCCVTCGTPYERVTKKGDPDRAHQRASGGNAEGEYHGQATKAYEEGRAENASNLKRRILQGMRPTITLGWHKACHCEELKTQDEMMVARSVVLDPFGGSGTVGLVANRLGRDAVLIEAKEEYATMAIRRIDHGLAKAEKEIANAKPGPVQARGARRPAAKGKDKGRTAGRARAKVRGSARPKGVNQKAKAKVKSRRPKVAKSGAKKRALKRGR